VQPSAAPWPPCDLPRPLLFFTNVGSQLQSSISIAIVEPPKAAAVWNPPGQAYHKDDSERVCQNGSKVNIKCENKKFVS